MKKLLIIPMLFMCSMVIGQSKKIIGKPIRLQRFEVAQYDFRKEMNWNDAKKACTDLGKGWRLPTKDELNVMYKNKDKIGGLWYNNYWSSSESGLNYAWLQGFNYGTKFFSNKLSTYYVRAVRAF